jgi:hypothetical protein
LSRKSKIAKELSKHITTIECPDIDATNNGGFQSSFRKLIAAPELSKHLTTSHSSSHDAINKCPSLLCNCF